MLDIESRADESWRVKVRATVVRQLPVLAGMFLIGVDGSITGWQWLLLPFGGALVALFLSILYMVIQSFVGWVGKTQMQYADWPLSPATIASLLAMCACVVIGAYLAGGKTDRVVRCIASMAPYGDSAEVERVAAHCRRVQP